MPTLYIITGSNGAGKSSIGPSFLPPAVRASHTVFDGDKLYMEHQKGLWQQGVRAIKEAKKLALAFVESTFDQLVESALQNRLDFVYEGHFTNEATWSVPQRFSAAGYQIHLIFLGLESPDISEIRVVGRSREGGHYVPRPLIEDNFYGNLEKLNLHYSLVDILKIIDTTDVQHRLLFHSHEHVPEYTVPRDTLPAWFTDHLPAICALFP